MTKGSLYEALARVPDPRQRRGKRHPLPATLTLLVVAMLSGSHSLSAVAMLERSRGHWGIENAVFYVRDVTFGEDHPPVRKGATPRGTVRNLAMTLLNLAGYTNKAAACRRHAAQPDALALLNIPPEN